MTSKTIIAPFRLDGVPQTGLSASIRIRDVNDGVLLVTDDAMTEVGDGFYKYIFTNYTSTMVYSIRCDGGVSLGVERYSFAGNDSFADDIWDEPMDFHTGSVFVSGSDTPLTGSGQMMNAIYDIEYGRWKVDTITNEMIFFKQDNTTEIARFSLFDNTGSAGSTDVFERVRKS